MTATSVENQVQYNGQVTEVLSKLSGYLNDDFLLDLASRFSETYRDLAKTSTSHFLVTPVTALPTGKEKGKFLSIDVGGTNLRVGFVELLGDLQNGTPAPIDTASQTPFKKIRRSHDRNWPIGDHLKMDKAEDLFAWIGDCIAEVIKDALDDATTSDSALESPLGEELLLGITFSFPMSQKSLSEATLLPMGKGFGITSDLNLGKMLLAGYARHIERPSGNDDANGDANSASKRRRLSRLPRIRIAAITNDTVATFASLAYAVKAKPNSRVAMGLIVGTGTNATVPMKLVDLHPAKRDDLANPDEVETVVINTEWTIQGTDKPLIDLDIKTTWDLELDANSEAPGFQPFEYMTAGRYLGEIVRLVFVEVIASEGTELPQSLNTKNAIATRFLSEVVARATDDELTKALGDQYAPISSSTSFWTPARVNLLRDIAYAVQQRSSALIAAASVGLLNCVGDIKLDRKETNGNGVGPHDEGEIEELVIAYAGGTISQYPQWRETCQRWIDTLVKKGSHANATKKVVLKEALDGGIIGAGVLASMTDDIA